MRTLRVITVTWILVDFGAALGWLLGDLFGRQTSFLFATVLGTLAILLAIKWLVGSGWINPERRRGGSIGGLCGFAIAAPLAAMNLDRPLLALSILAFVGVSVMIGAGPTAAR